MHMWNISNMVLGPWNVIQMCIFFHICIYANLDVLSERHTIALRRQEVKQKLSIGFAISSRRVVVHFTILLLTWAPADFGSVYTTNCTRSVSYVWIFQTTTVITMRSINVVSKILSIMTVSYPKTFM